jgi:DNA repair protein RecO
MSRPHQIHNSLQEIIPRHQDMSSPVIVLAVYPFRESDLMARLLTPTLGKISAIGRHARGSKKRFPSSIDLFDRGTVRLSREKNGALGLKEFSPSHALKTLRTNLEKLTAASLLCECFDRIIQEDTGDNSQDTFELLDLSLNAIDEACELKPVLRATVVGLTSLLKKEGIIDLVDNPTGKHTLLTALHAVETFSERRLLSRSALTPMLAKLSRA